MTVENFFNELKFYVNNQSQLQNLQELNLTSPINIDLSDIKTLYEKTSIRKIQASSLNYNSDILESKDVTFLDYPYNILKYNNLFILPQSKAALPKNLNFTTYDIIENMDDIKDIYSYIKPDKLNDYFTINIKDKSSYNTSENNHSVSITFNKEYEVECIHIRNNKTPHEVKTIIEYLEKLNLNIKDIEYYCENKTYSDIEELKEISKKYQLHINYTGSDLSADYDSFNSMRKSIDYYKSLIEENNLSPVKKLLYAYDIVKSFEYYEKEKLSSSARNIHSIIETGQIVCVGYSELLNEILKEIGIKSISIYVECYDEQNNCFELHKKNIVRIDDNKYDIHGLYLVDATWDSIKDKIFIVKDNNEKSQVRYNMLSTDTLLEEKDGMSLYKDFLVPLIDYTKVYKNDIIPDILKLYLDDNISNQKLRPSLEKQLYNLFNTTSYSKQIEDYFTCQKPSLEVFEEMLYQVRISEGYDQISAIKSVKDATEVNKLIDELYNENKKFFKSENNKKK